MCMLVRHVSIKFSYTAYFPGYVLGAVHVEHILALKNKTQGIGIVKKNSRSKGLFFF